MRNGVGYLLLVMVVAGILLSCGAAVAGELGIGDPAPRLSVAKWVKGDPVDMAAAKGKNIVVLDFWATWCGPCIESIPHLTMLQKRYGGKGVTIVGVTKEDPDNTLEAVSKFVQKFGDKLGYTIAFDDQAKTDKAFMEAAGETGIPTVFVIDQAGRIAWIGHPSFGLDVVIEELVAGKYDIKVAKKVAAAQRKGDEAWQDGDYEAQLKAADEWTSAKPQDPMGQWARFDAYHFGLEDAKNAYASAKQAVSLADSNASTLAYFAQKLAGQEDEKALQELGLRAAKRALELEPDNADAFVARFRILALTGRDPEAKDAAGQAIRIMKGKGSALGKIAWILSDAEWKHRYDDLALRAIELAITAEPDNARLLMTKFRVLSVSGSDRKSVERVGRYLIEKAGDDATLLNRFAWGLLTDDENKGKYAALALEAAQRSHELSGGTNWMFLDTYSLAQFESGSRAEAIELQKKAIGLCEDGIGLMELRSRLKGYEEAGH